MSLTIDPMTKMNSSLFPMCMRQFNAIVFKNTWRNLNTYIPADKDKAFIIVVWILGAFGSLEEV